MSAAVSIYAEQTSAQSTLSTSYVDVPGCTLSGFTAGKKYLIVVRADVFSATSTTLCQTQVAHGGTPFADSEQAIRINGANLVMAYAWFTVWEAVSSEDVTLQFKTDSSAVQADNVAMLAIKLSDDLTENTDWHLAERSNDDAITTSGVSGASITFTPGTASQDWLVLSYAQIDMTSTTLSVGSQIVRSGEASSTGPSTLVEAINAAEITSFMLLRPFTLGAASNTFTESSIAATTDNGTRLHSRIFALNLHQFAQRDAQFTAGPTALSATDYATTLESAALTPAVSGDVVALGYATFDRNNVGREFEYRLQVDGSDQPATQTSDNRQFYSGRDLRDAPGFVVMTRATLDTSAHTFSFDGSSDSTTGTPGVDDAAVVAFTLELAGGAATLAYPFRPAFPMSVLRQ